MTEPVQNIFLSVVLPIGLIVLTAVLSWIGSWFWFRRNHTAQLELKRIDTANDEREALRTRVTELEKQASILTASVLPISTAFQAILVKELTHYHTPEMDALLAKLGPPYVLEDGERDRLGVMLTERTTTLNGKIDNAERDAAMILPMVMKRAAVEARFLKIGKTGHDTLRLVTVPFEAESEK